MGAGKIGLIAGEGSLPLLFAQGARRQGLEVIAITFSRQVQSALNPCARTYLFGIGQPNKILQTLQREGVGQVALLGKMDKRLLFQRPRFDVKGIKLLGRLRNRNDSTILKLAVAELEQAGIQVVDQTLFLDQCLPEPGVLTRRRPTPEECSDVEYGLGLATRVAGLDIGQTVVVKRKTVLAIEAIEGTNETILRGCALGGRGVVVVKVGRPKQDFRFDLPTIGTETIQVMRQGGAAVLAVEAGKTLVVDLPEVVRQADAAHIAWLAVEPGGGVDGSLTHGGR